jgi:hypothetical protein
MINIGRLTISRLERLQALFAFTVYSSFDTGDIVTSVPVHRLNIAKRFEAAIP